MNFHEDKPMINRTINGAYPPGSTFKPFMALAALETGKRKPYDAIRDPGFFNFGGHTFRDDKAGGHGIVDMYKSIVHSCDTYYYVLANDMGIDRISEFMATVGFGQKTGIDLGKDDSGESRGVLPSKEWKKKRFKNPAQQKWFSGETISIGIGQGYNAYTPIQLASATATLANYGVMFRPHLVDYIEDKKLQKIRRIEATPLKDLGWNPENVKEIHRGMMGVMMMLIWYPNRKKTTPFRWRWSIIFISVFLSAADFVYLYALSLPGAMISVVSMIRRGSVIVSFLFAAIVFREKNLRSKAIDLALVLLGMVFLYLGSR